MIKTILFQSKKGDPEQYCPAFFCEQCGQHIDNIALGSYQYIVDENGEATSEVFVMHKQCMDALRAKYPEDFNWRWDELSRLFDQLKMNATPIPTWK